MGGKTIGFQQGDWLGNIFVPYDYERVLYREVVEAGPDGVDAVSLWSPRVLVPAVLVAAVVAAEMKWQGKRWKPGSHGGCHKGSGLPFPWDVEQKQPPPLVSAAHGPVSGAGGVLRC